MSFTCFVVLWQKISHSTDTGFNLFLPFLFIIIVLTSTDFSPAGTTTESQERRLSNISCWDSKELKMSKVESLVKTIPEVVSVTESVHVK